MKKTKIWSILLLVVMMMPLVASCGGDDSDDNQPKTEDMTAIYNAKIVGLWNYEGTSEDGSEYTRKHSKEVLDSYLNFIDDKNLNRIIDDCSLVMHSLRENKGFYRLYEYQGKYILSLTYYDDRLNKSYEISFSNDYNTIILKTGDTYDKYVRVNKKEDLTSVYQEKLIGTWDYLGTKTEDSNEYIPNYSRDIWREYITINSDGTIHKKIEDDSTGKQIVREFSGNYQIIRNMNETYSIKIKWTGDIKTSPYGTHDIDLSDNNMLYLFDVHSSLKYTKIN